MVNENENENENYDNSNDENDENDEQCVVFCKMGDILGVYIDLELKTMKLYHNNTFISSITVTFWTFSDTLPFIFYPTIRFDFQNMCKYTINFLPEYPTQL